MSRRRRNQRTNALFNGIILLLFCAFLVFVVVVLYANSRIPTPPPMSAATRTLVIERTSTPRPINAFSAGGGSSSCPRNCDEARTRGVSAARAAACGLDRDNDGVACYGD